MKNKQKVISVALIAICMIFVLGYNQKSTAKANNLYATATENPTIQALEANLETQEAEINLLRSDFDNSQSETADVLRDYRWMIESRVFQISVFSGLVGIVLAYLGISSIRGLEEKIQNRINQVLEKEVYHIDPTMKKIYVPMNLDHLTERLELSKLMNVRLYNDLNRQNTKGITIVQIESEEDENIYKKFLDAYTEELDPYVTAFILYTTSNHRISKDTANKFKNTSIANMPTSIVNAILAVSRGLIP